MKQIALVILLFAFSLCACEKEPDYSAKRTDELIETIEGVNYLIATAKPTHTADFNDLITNGVLVEQHLFYRNSRKDSYGNYVGWNPSHYIVVDQEIRNCRDANPVLLDKEGNPIYYAYQSYPYSGDALADIASAIGGNTTYVVAIKDNFVLFMHEGSQEDRIMIFALETNRQEVMERYNFDLTDTENLWQWP